MHDAAGLSAGYQTVARQMILQARSMTITYAFHADLII